MPGVNPPIDPAPINLIKKGVVPLAETSHTGISHRLKTLFVTRKYSISTFSIEFWKNPGTIFLEKPFSRKKAQNFSFSRISRTQKNSRTFPGIPGFPGRVAALYLCRKKFLEVKISNHLKFAKTGFKWHLHVSSLTKKISGS